jgi:hypothetical protein
MGMTGKLVKDTIIKTSLPPLQKAAVVFGGTILGGMAYSKITETGRNAEIAQNITTYSVPKTNSTSHISKLIDDSTISPLQNILSYIEITDYIMIYLLTVLIIQILFKLYFKDSVSLNLSSILGTKLNNALEYYINKIIILNKKMSVF